MIPDFPHNIRKRLDNWNFCFLRPGVAKSLPCWLSQCRKAKLRQPKGQRLNNVRAKQRKFSIGLILFLYCKESPVLSNLNSKQLRFDGVRPNVYRNLDHFHGTHLLGNWYITLGIIWSCGITLCKVKKTKHKQYGKTGCRVFKREITVQSWFSDTFSLHKNCH
jgi:hypothetical protein